MLEWFVLIGWCLAIIFGGTILSLYQKNHPTNKVTIDTNHQFLFCQPSINSLLFFLFYFVQINIRLSCEVIWQCVN